MTATTALYRRYRPDSFADVIGQEHVTEPLMTALRKNRVNHAYLFSGPRGCGKTTSARILARCLNCAEGPTDAPCGRCDSCVELARGGPGSLDVIEIDAASHGGVDDARDLRERATFAPVRDRYKIFIIDEAHMVTSAGFNALLKIVEEPPEHIKFIFATTEPDKVIGTIRSRTHHYPFRLVPPEPLLAYLEALCRQENVPVAPGVLSLVIRAGGGSVRDTLSVLDQLMAGAGPGGLDYELAVALLGYTHASLLDDVVDAVAASDSATVFRAVDRVIQTGHDPRRFVEDLLERFRDLIIVRAMPESAPTLLRGTPADQIARLQNQAHSLGASELSRAADVTNTALTEMTGATSPRLHLELLCARILLPSAEQTERGIAARIDRVERRLNYAGQDVGSPALPAASPAGRDGAGAAEPPVRTAPAPASASASASASLHATAVPPGVSAPVEPVSTQKDSAQITAPRVSTADWPREDSPRVIPAPPAAVPAPVPVPVQQDVAGSSRTAQPDEARAAAPETPSGAGPATSPPDQLDAARSGSAPRPSAPAAAAPAHGDVEVLRRAWPDVLQTLSKIKRSTWALVEPNAKVTSFEGQTLTLAFTTSGLAGAFGRADHADNLRQAIHKTVGIDCQITAISGGSAPASAEPNPKAPVTRDVPQTSVDEAWGLVPAGSAPAPAATVRQPDRAPASAPSEASRAATTAPAEPTTPADAAALAGAGDLLPAAPSAASPVRAASTASTGEIPAAKFSPAVPGPDAGISSYPDDDWGPPLDEDAPPLDEEPPLDWVPTPGPARGSLPAAPAAAPQDVPAPSDSMHHRAPDANAKPPHGTLSGSASVTAIPDTPGSAGPALDDPWSRAVEQAPGVWEVAAERNVSVAESPASDASSAQPVDSPTGAVKPGGPQPAAADADPEDGSGWPSPPAAWVQDREPAYAMAAAAPSVLSPGNAQGHTAEQVPQPVPTARQSLYQRLSNSPEAQAGRARLSQGAAAASTPYVQDIPDPEDETIEESGVFGRAAVERILGGKLIEERSLDGSPMPPRF